MKIAALRRAAPWTRAPWLRIVAVGLVAAAGGAVAAVTGPAYLPLRPLAEVSGPPDDYDHVLVKVPAGMATKKVTRPDGKVVELPAPLADLAARGDVADVSSVDGVTWRVTGDVPAKEVAAATGLSTSDDLLLYSTETDDTYWNLLWALENRGGTVGGFPATEDVDVDGVEANTKSTGTGVIVAVVDSAIQPDHPDLPALWRNRNEVCGNSVDDDHNGYVDDCTGWDFVRRDSSTYDAGANNNHGTHVAGTIAAIPNNGRGTAGLAPGVTLMSLKITEDGSILLSNAAEAIRYAADQGAKVINASFGTSPGAPREAAALLESAISYAASKGVLVVAAAGNDGVNTDAQAVWPADLPLDNIISVGASTAAEQRASFSNYGASTVDLFAPGHYIASTVDHGGYEAYQGTSMATPHVAAAAALVLSSEPTLTPAEVRERLLTTTDRIAGYDGKSVSGGRLNADRAVQASQPAKVTVEAAAFDDFSADTEHTGTLTIKAAADLFPDDATVTWQATLLTAVDGATYGVVEQPVTVNGEELATDANAQVLLGPVDGVPAVSSELVGDGVRVALGTNLPAGEYALVIDVVTAADRQYGFGPSVAVFFTVPAPGEDAPDATDPTPQPSDSGSPTPGASDPGSGGSTPGSGGSTPGSGGSTPGTSDPGSGGSTPGSGGSTPGSGGSTPGTSDPGSGGSTPGSGGSTPGSGGSTPGSGGSTPGSGGSTPGSGGSTPGTSDPGSSDPGSGGGTPTQPPVTHDGITITSVSPSHGDPAGGNTVMIVGSNFPDYPVVYFGAQPAYVAVQGLASLSVVVPSGVAGSTVDVTVADRTGNAVTMPGAYRYDQGASDQPSDGSTPGSGGSTPGSGGSTPGSGGSTPGSGGSTPGSGGSTPDSGSSPTVAPSASPSAGAAGPGGTQLRPPPRLDAPVTRAGLRLALVLGDNPVAAISPAQWGSKRCIRVLCAGQVVR